MSKQRRPDANVYVGDNLEVIANLTPATNSSKVLADVAKWHERRHSPRNRTIAAALRTASGTRPAAVNDNLARKRRVA